MNAERDDIPDIIDALRAELAAVEPSPRFAAGVRERVEQQSSRRLPGLRFALAAATVGLVAIGAYLVRPGEGIQSVSSVSPLSPLSVETSTPVAAPIPATPAPARAPRPRVQPLAAPRAAAQLAVAVGSSEPSLEVITNQPRLIRELWTRAVAGGFLDRPVIGVESVFDIASAPIVVEPIVVPWLGRSGGDPPAARRVVADDLGRGAQR